MTLVHRQLVALFFITFALNVHAVTIKLGSLAPEGSPWDTGLRKMSAQWNTLSKGSVKMKIYPGGIAGDEADMIRKMRIRQLSAAGITGIGLSRIYNGVLAIQLPMQVQTDEELYHVLEHMAPQFEKELEAKGFTVLVWTKVGWVHFFSKQPVRRPSDLQQQKQFMWAGDPDGVQAWKDAGFHPVPLQVTDMMAALQSGMIEAFSTTPLSAASYQWFGLAPHMCAMKWAPLVGAIVVSTPVWNKIKPELRQSLLQASREIGEEMQKEIDKADAEAIHVMKQNGLTIHDVPDDAHAEWEKVVHIGFKQLAGKSFDAGSAEKIKRILKEYRNADAH